MESIPATLYGLIPALLLQETIFGVPGYERWVIMFFFISSYTVAIPLALGVMSISKLDQGLKYFLSLLVLILITETSAFAMGAFNIRNLDVYNIFTGIEYAFFVLMFTSWWGSRTIKRLLMGSIPFFIITWIVTNYAFEVTPTEFNTVFLSVESVLFVILAVITLLREMQDSSRLLVDNPVFWIASGVLIYFAGNLFVFTLMDTLIRETDIRPESVYLIHTILNITKNILFSIGFFATGGPKEKIVSGWRRIRHRPA